MRAFPSLLLFVGALASGLAAWAAPVPDERAVPALTLAGPYGDPLAMRPLSGPASLAALPSPVVLSGGDGPDPDPHAAAVERRLATPAPARQGAATVLGTDPDEEHLPPIHPGTFRPGRTVIPGFPDTNRVVTPHLTPDLELARTRRTTVGVFGEVGHLEVETRPGSLPSIRPQGLGAGLSLQYKFGE